MFMETNLVLNPAGKPSQKAQQDTPALQKLERTTVGFLSTFWPSYEPLVDHLGLLLQETCAVQATPRMDYWRRPRLVDVWREHRDLISRLDAAVVGLGG